jgi:hypothetical protein
MLWLQLWQVDKACYLKQTVANAYWRKDPSSTSVLQSNIRLPPQSTLPEQVKSRSLTFFGTKYRIDSNTRSRDACKERCEKESKCLGYTFHSGDCDLFERLDYATRSPPAQSGFKAQHPP